MFKNLPASSGAKRGIFSGKTAIPSLIFHGLLIAGGVYASVQAEKAGEAEEELVEFVDIQEEEKAPEPEKPDEPEPPPPPQAATQALEPPAEPPPSIPKVDLSAPPVTAEDFTGIGVVAEKAAPPPPGPPAPPGPPPPPPADFAYEVAVLDKVPVLSNKGAIGSIMERLYPRLLQDAGIGGTVVMQFVIEPNGTVDMSSAKVLESSNEQLSDASLKAIQRFKFRPGLYKGQPVRVLIQMPITWQPAG